MSISADKVTFDDAMIWVQLVDGRVMGVPLVWFPKLAGASAEELAVVEICPFGLHWDALDEDVSVVALVEGRVLRRLEDVIIRQIKLSPN